MSSKHSNTSSHKGVEVENKNITTNILYDSDKKKSKKTSKSYKKNKINNVEGGSAETNFPTNTIGHSPENSISFSLLSDEKMNVENLSKMQYEKIKNVTEQKNEIIITNCRKNKICLNMIVKNESKVIMRLLDSVYKVIDCYCICDTGSTDNTIQIITDFFKYKQIPGKIIQEPFRDFGYNRSFALKACETMDAEYILLLDADMVLQINNEDNFYKEINKPDACDIYYIFQGSPSFFYKNVRMVKNRKGYYYWGVTHEYVKTPDGTKYGLLERDNIFINDIGDGGCKTDKFERDIQLLKRGLEQEPNNDRYTFYLANSYRDSGQHQNAIDTYKKRIEIGGWFDEVWHSYYSIGKCYKNLGDMVNAVHWWLEAYQFYPNRIENLYEIIHHYRCIGKNTIAYGIYLMAESERLRNNNTDYLFLQKEVYDYKLDYELSIIGYYCNYNNHDLRKVSMKVLNCPLVEENISRNVISNYKFYSKNIVDFAVKTSKNDNNLKMLKTIGNNIPEIRNLKETFSSSTPAIHLMQDTKDLLINVRFVDYFINDKGGYENRGNIRTKNVVAQIDTSTDEWEITNEFVLGYNDSIDNLYVGLEDLRLFSLSSSPTKIKYNCNRGLSYHNIKIEYGEIDLINKKTNNWSLLEKEGQFQVEKNWVLFENSKKQQKIIYGWYPLVVGDISKDSHEFSDKFVVTNTINSPYLFKNLRGSTNGVLIGDEVWFINHIVSYEDRRYYYHIFVVLDSTTYSVKKYSYMFTFEKEKVEYTLGFVHLEETDEILIGYSILDKTTEYMTVPKSEIEKMMISTFFTETNV
jgi:tetratricopeptide (TPR) repeat protein